MSNDKIAKVISIHNNKGGVLKSTLAVNIGSKLFKDGKKVLLMDLDGQGNLLGSWNVNANKLKYSIYDVFTGEAKVEDAIYEPMPGLKVLPANSDMFMFESDVVSGDIKVKIAKIIKSVQNDFDYIIIDTPASQGLNTTGALRVTNQLVIPFSLDPWGISGVKDLIKHLKKNILDKNPGLEKVLLVPTMFVANSRNQIDGLKAVEEWINKKGKMFKLSKYQVQRSVSVSNAILDLNMPIMLTNRKNKIKDSMAMIAKETM